MIFPLSIDNIPLAVLQSDLASTKTAEAGLRKELNTTQSEASDLKNQLRKKEFELEKVEKKGAELDALEQKLRNWAKKKKKEHWARGLDVGLSSARASVRPSFRAFEARRV